MRRIDIDALDVVDEPAYGHIAIYGALRAYLERRGAQLAVVAGPASEDRARLLNHAFWKPGDLLEVVAEPVVAADQLAHGAWHLAVADHLGDAATTPEGLLLAESIASAFDLYLVGRLLGMGKTPDLLETQVPAMREAAAIAGLTGEPFEALLSRAHARPEASFEQLRVLLYALSRALVVAPDADAAADALAAAEDHPLAPLTHHYELSTWVLFCRVHGTAGTTDAVDALDTELRAASDPIAVLERLLDGAD